VFEVWFDGACGEGPGGKKQVYDWPAFFSVVRECQPNAVIFSDGGPDVRWVGDEDGFAGETNWSVLRRGEVYPGYPRYNELTSGHADGNAWVPAECDVSIRPGWFYHSSQDDSVKSLTSLVDIYFGSVGRNASLLLNVPVDRRGLISDADAQRLGEFRMVLDAMFGRNLVEGAIASATAVRGGTKEYAALNAIDGDPTTYWATDDNVRMATLTVALPESRRFNCVILQEYLPLGQRVEEFSIEVARNATWRSVCGGTTIGHKRLLRIPGVDADSVRLVITKSRACPAISNFGLFMVPPIPTGGRVQ
jgi:alpha-L-fucosidase